MICWSAAAWEWQGLEQHSASGGLRIMRSERLVITGLEHESLPAQGEQLWKEGLGQPKAWVGVFSMRMMNLHRERKWIKRQFISLIWAISRASLMTRRKKSPAPCVYFLIYKYWFGLDPCFEIGSQSATLSLFWGYQWPPSQPAPISHLFYLQYLELTLKVSVWRKDSTGLDNLYIPFPAINSWFYGPLSNFENMYQTASLVPLPDVQVGNRSFQVSLLGTSVDH